MVQYSPPSDIDVVEPSFGEVFAASVGFVIDEEQSTSSMYNNESLTQRQTAVSDLVADGFDLSPYIDQSGDVDYDRLSTVAPSVLSSEALFNQRNELLAKRRAYSEDVKERGSGMAQFLGAMTGYMLDPVNVATLPIGASASVLRGLGVMARVGRVAAIEGAVGLTAESLIQPFVFQHKNEIGSPYSVDDALTAIGTAALGGAALGGATAGVAGVLRSVGRIADDYPGDIDAQGSAEVMMKASEDILKNPDRSGITESIGESARYFFSRPTEEIGSEIAVLRAADDLTIEESIRLETAEAVMESRKGRWSKKIKAEIEDALIQERATLTEGTKARLKRGDKKALRAGIEDLRARLSFVEEEPPLIQKKKGVSARKAKAVAQAKVKAAADTERAAIQTQIDNLTELLDSSAPGDIARAELSRLDQGIYSKRLREKLAEINHRRLVDTDIEYMRRLESERTSVKKATPDTYEVNAERLGPEAYEQADIDAFEALGEDGIVRMGDENVSAREFIDARNIELEGLEAARVCSIV